MNTDVKLIAVTQPQVPGINSAEEFVAYVARVSNPTNQLNTETSNKLVKYLIKNKHWSPFEMVNICVEITTTRDIARQILRHRSFSFQEFSQRYADPTEFMSFDLRESRLQDTKNRQNSIELDLDQDPQRILAYQWEQLQAGLAKTAIETYRWAIDSGIAKEQARAVLPEGLTPSRLYMNGTLRSWLHYVELRASNGTQKEHREIAEKCRHILSREFPSIAEIINETPENNTR
jgi:thymidylate synthase (FAD)